MLNCLLVRNAGPATPGSNSWDSYQSVHSLKLQTSCSNGRFGWWREFFCQDETPYGGKSWWEEASWWWPAQCPRPSTSAATSGTSSSSAANSVSSICSRSTRSTRSQLKLDRGEWRNNHRRRTLKEHVVIGIWPKKITRWKKLACEQHGQSFAHASRQTGEDVVPILMVNSGRDDVGLQLSYFQCHSDGKQVFKKAHLKVVQIGREGWVAVLQKTVGVHNLSSLLQKQRTPTCYPVHISFWKIVFLSRKKKGKARALRVQLNLPPDIMNWQLRTCQAMVWFTILRLFNGPNPFQFDMHKLRPFSSKSIDLGCKWNGNSQNKYDGTAPVRNTCENLASQTWPNGGRKWPNRGRRVRRLSWKNVWRKFLSKWLKLVLHA